MTYLQRLSLCLWHDLHICTKTNQTNETQYISTTCTFLLTFLMNSFRTKVQNNTISVSFLHCITFCFQRLTFKAVGPLLVKHVGAIAVIAAAGFSMLVWFDIVWRAQPSWNESSKSQWRTPSAKLPCVTLSNSRILGMERVSTRYSMKRS